MDNYIKKNISEIIAIFLLIQPFLDLLTGICIHTLRINITVGIITRIIFLLFIVYIVLFVFKKKNVLIPYLIIGLYFIFYIIGTFLYKDSNYLFEIQNLVKVFYFPILLISFYSIKDKIKISNLALFTVLFTYLLLIFIPTILQVGYKTYEITKVGTLGFFNSANEVGGIISILTPIIFIIFYESKKILPIILSSIIYLIVILMMGTKTPLLTLLLTMLFTLIYLWIQLKKQKKYKEIFLSLLIIIITSLSLILIMPKTNFYKNIRTHLDYLELNHIYDVFKDEKYIDHFIFSSRLKFLNNKSKIYNNSNIYQKIFGIGYINNGKETKMIEMDYFDILFSHGIIGFLIFMTVFITVLYDVYINRKKHTYESYILGFSTILIILLSFITGHIITAPAVSLIVIIILLSQEKKDKKDLLFASKSMIIGGIEQAQVNLLNSIDYNKYNVVLVLEEKKGELLDKINKNVIIKEIKVSDNKIIILRKIINTYRKLIFKLFNYMNYDFSCCYTTYSYSSNKIARIASMNNSIYIHSDYKYIYKDENEYKNFFDSRRINEFKTIIFVSNESKESFIKYYKELENKTKVINNLVNVEEIISKSKDKIIEEKPSKKLFVFVGRLDDKSKKLKRAIKLSKELDIELWIIGDGPDKKMYEDYTNELNISKQVKFLGKKDNPYSYMSRADYIILTSDYEGFPVVYLEALVLNKKIFTTIRTSDDQIDMKDYAYIISKDNKKLVEDVKKVLDNKPKLKTINIKKIQSKRIEDFEKLFNN